jgi:hypothetical protein
MNLKDMKNKGLQFFGLFLTIILITGGNAVAQRGGRMGAWNGCCMGIPGLTDQQRTEISNLENQHRKEMDALRSEWRKSGAYSQREAHLTEVDKKVEAHRDAVRKLLNEEQKSFFDNQQGRYKMNRTGREPGMGNVGAGRGGCCGGGRFGRGWSNN